jgi:hypothetical protein
MRAPFWSRSSRLRLSVSVLPLIAIAYCPPLLAANPDSAKPSRQAVASAEALLEEALACEIYGLDEEREALLSRAEALAPELPAVKWQRGMLLVDGKWAPAEQVAVAPPTDSLLAQYVAKRDASADTLADQLALAQWCQKQKLLDQERAHLVRVLKHEPNHAQARARLGYVLIEGEWISREEIARALAEEAKAQASIKKHGAGFRSVLSDLTSEHVAVRERALEKVRAIRDPEMIPALERLVAGASEEASFAVLQALAAMPEKEATQSIARFAVLSPDSRRVRDDASDLLKDRKFDHFVPQMVASMRSPVQANYAFERRIDARLVYRQIIYREGAGSAEAVVQDLVYANSQPSLYFNRNGAFLGGADYLGRRLPRAGNDRDDRAVAEAAVHDALYRNALDRYQVAIENADVRELNLRVGEALSTATGESLGPDPQAWWKWWDQYEQLHQAGPKQVAVQYEQSWQSVGRETYPDRVRIADIRQPQDISCFAAGTSVLTNRGEVAIEQMRVGDLVLAQDVETGEIAFKPVLETTVRPPAELLRVEHERGSFRCTGGHPFWVSGEGWVHAKRLKSGTELHTLDGSVRVSDVVPDGEEETYNLIVADFANYFVSDARILSHDNSSRQPTDAVVPGLLQK